MEQAESQEIELVEDELAESDSGERKSPLNYPISPLQAKTLKHPDKRISDEVIMCAAIGFNKIRISRVIGLPETLLKRHYSEEMDTGHDRIVQRVAGMLLRKALIENDITAQIFYLKCHGGWQPNNPASSISVMHDSVGEVRINFTTTGGAND